MEGVIINWWGVLVAALLVFFLGPAWYGPFLGKPWMKAAGIDSSRWDSERLPLLVASSFIIEFIMAATLAVFLGNAPSVEQGLLQGFLTGLVFVLLPLLAHTLYESRPFANALIHGGFWIVALTCMGFIVAYHQGS